MRVILMATVGIVLGCAAQAAPFDFREEAPPRASASRESS